MGPVVGNSAGEIKLWLAAADGSLEVMDPGRRRRCRAGIDVETNVAPQVVERDGDGTLDRVVGNSAGAIKLWLSAADGSLELMDSGADPLSVIDVGTNAAPHVVDRDGDGNLDLAVGNSAGEIKL